MGELPAQSYRSVELGDETVTVWQEVERNGVYLLRDYEFSHMSRRA